MKRLLTPFRLVVFFTALSVAALVLCLPRLQLQYLPQPAGTLLQVSFGLPGATPQVVEQQVTSVLENHLAALSDIEQLYSKSLYNEGQVTLRFKKGSDMQQKQFEAAAILRRLYPQLPPATSYPTLEVQASGTDTRRRQPLLIYSLFAPLQEGAIAQAIEAYLLPALRQLPGVQRVALSGTPQQQLSITYQPALCQAWGIAPESIGPALQQALGGWYGGAIAAQQGTQQFVHLSATHTTPEAAGRVVVYTRSGQAVPLSTFCTLRLEEEKPGQWMRINGQNALRLSIYAQPGENEITLSSTLRTAMDVLKTKLPVGYTLLLDYDDAEFLRTEIGKNNRRASLCMAILLVFMLAAYRNLRHLLVVTASLLVTLSLTVLLAYLAGVPIHLYSIAGTAIAFGLLIDNAIVMLDYYRQYRNLQAFLALLAATLTTIAALAMVFLLPENDRLNLGDFAAIIALALAASLMSSLGFTPALYELVNRSHKESLPPPAAPSMAASPYWQKNYYRSVIFLARYKKTVITGCILVLGLPLFMLPDTLPENKPLAPLYNATVGNPWYRQHLRPIVDKYLGGALYQFRYNVFEKGGYRSPEKTRLYVQAELPFGHTPEQMNQLMQSVDGYLRSMPGISKFVTNVYSGQEAGVEIQFTPEAEAQGLPYALKSRLITRAVDWGGANWDVYGVGRGFSNAGGMDIPNFRLKLMGYNYDATERLAQRLANRLLEHPRIQKVNTNERDDWNDNAVQEYVLTLDAKHLAHSGATTAAVFEVLQQQSAPVGPALYLPVKGLYTPVKIAPTNAENFSVYQLLHQSLALDSIRQMNLKQAAALSLTTTANSIVRENRSYVRVVSFDYLGSAHFGDKFLEKVLTEITPSLAAGYTIERDYYSWDWGRTQRQYGLLALLALVIFCICAILLGRLRQAFYIVCMIPLSFVGLMLAFAWGDFYFDQGGYAAFVLLSGLVVNAAIYVVNDWNHLQKMHPEIPDNTLLLQASYNRARTILLTAISTIAGMLPFLWEGQQEIFWFSFAVGAMGGLAISLPAVWWVLPVLLWRERKDKKTSFPDKKGKN